MTYLYSLGIAPQNASVHKNTQQHCICGPLAPASSPLRQDPAKGSGSAHFCAVRIAHGPSHLVISPKRTSRLNLVSPSLLTWPVMVAPCGVSFQISPFKGDKCQLLVCAWPPCLGTTAIHSERHSGCALYWVPWWAQRFCSLAGQGAVRSCLPFLQAPLIA